MGYTSYNPAMPGFLGDRASLDYYPTGVEIAWADVIDDPAYVDLDGNKFVKAGTLMAIDPTTGKMIPHQIADVAYTDVIGHLASNAHEDSQTDALSGYGVYTAGNIFENLLPEFLDAWWAATGQAASAALGFKHYTYSDDRS